MFYRIQMFDAHFKEVQLCSLHKENSTSSHVEDFICLMERYTIPTTDSDTSVKTTTLKTMNWCATVQRLLNINMICGVIS